MNFLFTATKKICDNEHGMALVSALLLGLIGMLMVISLLLMVDTGTWISGSQKRFHTALDAAHGGMNFFAKEIIQRGLGGVDLDKMGDYGKTNGEPLLTRVISGRDFTTKLTTTGKVGDPTYPDDTRDATLTLTFPTGPNFAVHTAILSTSRGNSGTSSNLLLGGGVVNNNSGTMTPPPIPYLYQIEAQGQNAANPIENARLSSLYIY